jgi:hypothetical protein
MNVRHRTLLVLPTLTLPRLAHLQYTGLAYAHTAQTLSINRLPAYFQVSVVNSPSSITFHSIPGDSAEGGRDERISTVNLPRPTIGVELAPDHQRLAVATHRRYDRLYMSLFMNWLSTDQSTARHHLP